MTEWLDIVISIMLYFLSLLAHLRHVRARQNHSGGKITKKIFNQNKILAYYTIITHFISKICLLKFNRNTCTSHTYKKCTVLLSSGWVHGDWRRSVNLLAESSFPLQISYLIREPMISLRYQQDHFLASWVRISYVMTGGCCLDLSTPCASAIFAFKYRNRRSSKK